MTRSRDVANTQTNSGGAVSPFLAGKNKIINGDFRINQRAFTSNTSTGSYNFDRFRQINGGSSGTLTVTPQTFTAGTAPVSEYEAINFVRCVTASGASANTFAQLQQLIEDVRTFAGQTITVSFWAKAGSGTPNIQIEIEQNFGSGGSASVYTATTKQAITTSWARYSFTVAVPSVSGKTIGTSSFLATTFWLSAGSDFNTRSNTLGLQNATFDIWGVQVEAGSVATPFTTATGTLAGELSLCRRYLPAVRGGTATAAGGYIGYAYGTNTTIYVIPFDVPARVSPTGITVSGTIRAFSLNTGTTVTPTFNSASVNSSYILATPTITAGQGSRLDMDTDSLILFTGCEL